MVNNFPPAKGVPGFTDAAKAPSPEPGPEKHQSTPPEAHPTGPQAQPEPQPRGRAPPGPNPPGSCPEQYGHQPETHLLGRPTSRLRERLFADHLNCACCLLTFTITMCSLCLWSQSHFPPKSWLSLNLFLPTLKPLLQENQYHLRST